MAGHNCESCGMRKRHDSRPRSILGRLWRWHINWCPGWRSYVKSMAESDRNEIITRYGLTGEKWRSMT